MTQPIANTAEISAASGRHQLEILGITAASLGDPVANGTVSIVLLGPKEPGFWAHLQDQPEALDGQPDPVDRWSERAVTELARSFGGQAVFPFGGAPHAPFIAWALRSGRAWSSPVTLLVHDTAGLLVSFRGAICLPYRLEQTPPPAKPCDSCAQQPCRSACPVQALTAQGYDLAVCHQFLDTAAGGDCMDQGCAVRRACPVSQAYGRNPEQSAHHMKAFHP